MIKQQIEKYVPVNKQEEKDKELILHLMETYSNLLDRSNQVAHFTSSAFVFNKTRDKCLMIYHNIYNSWAWTGGHNDGDENAFFVAQKELVEETGIQNFTPITTEIFALDVMCVHRHEKRGQFVPSHLHLNTTFVFEAEESDALFSNPEENSGVEWILISELEQKVNEAHVLPIYKKIIDKVKNNF